MPHVTAVVTFTAVFVPVHVRPYLYLTCPINTAHPFRSRSQKVVRLTYWTHFAFSLVLQMSYARAVLLSPAPLAFCHPFVVPLRQSHGTVCINQSLNNIHTYKTSSTTTTTISFSPPSPSPSPSRSRSARKKRRKERHVLPLSRHARRRLSIAQRLVITLVFVMPPQLQGAAFRNRTAAVFSMACDVAESLCSWLPFPHHELIALFLHLTVSLLMLSP